MTLTEANKHHPRKYPETWLAIDKLGSGARPYRPTYEGFGNAISDFHRYLMNCPMDGVLVALGLDGWLLRADALKIYELGYFANGDILEFGTNKGLSTFILSKAIMDSGRKSKVVTMELSPDLVKVARANLEQRGVLSFVELRTGDANDTCLGLTKQGHKFSLAFVDHSHAYEHVALACRHLAELLVDGSFCLFHDFNDRRNTTRVQVGESGEEYGVYAAVQDSLDQTRFEFYGIFGCCGVYRKVR